MWIGWLGWALGGGQFCGGSGWLGDERLIWELDGRRHSSIKRRKTEENFWCSLYKTGGRGIHLELATIRERKELLDFNVFQSFREKMCLILCVNSLS